MPITLTLRAALAPLRVRRTILPALLMVIPAATQTQRTPQTKSCPRFARVPGYGACTNTGGRTCGFCTYRCNDETVVRWNVCGA